MMTPAGVELEMLDSEPDALTTRPPPCVLSNVITLTSLKYATN